LKALEQTIQRTDKKVASVDAEWQQRKQANAAELDRVLREGPGRFVHRLT